ncbi:MULTISPECIES: sulfur carrier protein ThiS [Fusobacterium]|jgi:sulfur carrier protein|uniref:Thiamine biosynthesis protein ThiS n=1 Tax=Fusobacterium varium ATCC 27725 TaxID=469618 RepID=A0ABN5JIP7_FUSVA|nr:MULTISPECIES: sulfur carrier protein ThiS [Fusobacterium]AVQ32122.1 thiamine biosynthesis protein ThiS [Fusobacterium varium ATCC 27725]EES63491.1 thiamine biosynthesis protein ThiS [Fusobacterium varium ATCC 27725]MCD7979684.1 sulfur carrier protein ThiS [Fusobacterium sp.]MCF0169347.1 sulfur carrier protein ThiS [Fusobacterium varium]MCF2673673.1 sulfur carrier protein ThiS [Fusobacterium varium]
MNIILNGKNYSLEENFTVQKLLKKLEEDWSLDLSGAVVLVNDEIVKKDRWEESKIFENAEIEVLSFVSGG